MDLLALMRNEAAKIQVKEITADQNIILIGFERNHNTGFDFQKNKGGIVYGLAISLNDEKEKELLLQEAITIQGSHIQSKEDMIALPNYTNLYPLYWGKSELIWGRINAHVEGHKNNNLHLKN